MCLDDSHRWKSNETIAWLRTRELHSVPNSIKADIGDLVYNGPKKNSLDETAALAPPPGRFVYFFFLRLPYGQYGPVSQLSRSEKSCTGPFNWGEAHCAGENVKRRTGPFQRKSLMNQTRTATQQRGAARHGNQEPPGQAPRCTGRKKKQPTQTRDFTDRSWYALTYIEMPRTML